MGMGALSTRYARLLCLDDRGRVDSVDFRFEDRRVGPRVPHLRKGVFCPECGEAYDNAQRAKGRRSRHLDNMGIVSKLVARLPRCSSPDQGAKTIAPPWPSGPGLTCPMLRIQHYPGEYNLETLTKSVWSSCPNESPCGSRRLKRRAFSTRLARRRSGHSESGGAAAP